MKKENKLTNWLKEIARDSLALGSIPMFIIVIARASIGSYYNFVYQILLAGLILAILSLFITYQPHIARAIIIFIFMSFFYNDSRFTLFSAGLLVLILISLFYLKYSKKQIFYGVIFGLISSLISFYLIPIK